MRLVNYRLYAVRVSLSVCGILPDSKWLSSSQCPVDWDFNKNKEIMIIINKKNTNGSKNRIGEV